jgi:IgA peptidase M64
MPMADHRMRSVTIALVAVFMATILCEASAEPVTTIRANGDSGNRVDIAILGDGYTASELDKYASDVETFVQNLFSQEWFQEYQGYFNVHRVDVISNESGASHPEQNPPVLKDTALDATYNCAGIQRLICANASKVNTVLSTSVAPDMRDVVLIIVNDSEYGGSGGAFAVASVNPAVVEIIRHELGHSFGLLADEYGGPPPPFCDASAEPPEPNVTKQTQRDLIKWTLWIDPSTPLPTPGPTVAEPGLYEGAKYCDTGLFRPTYTSRMRSLGFPYEQINSEQLVKRVYNLASPIDAVGPTDTAVTLTQGQSQTFRVQTPQPFTHVLDIVWNVDGQATTTGSEFTLNASALSPGSHTVEVVVSDPTPLVRNDPTRVLSEARRWNVVINVAQSAAEMIVDLIESVKGQELPPSLEAFLVAELQTALANPNNVRFACFIFDGFIRLIESAAGWGSIPAARATQLITEARAIKTALGC